MPSEPPSKTRIWRSEGQRLFSEIPLKGKVIAKTLKMTPTAISLWLSGDRKPLPDKRREIQDLWGIALDAWDQKPCRVPVAAASRADTCSVSSPSEPAPRARPAPQVRRVEPARDAPPPLPAIDPEDPLGGVRALVDRCRLGMQTQGLSSSEQKSWQDQLLAAMKMADTIQGQQAVREDMIARTPAFKRLCGVIIAALESYPEALGAVVDALEPHAGG